MNTRQTGMLVAVAALWGASFLFIRIGAPAVGPIWLTGLRMALAGVVLLVYGMVTGYKPKLHGRSWQWLVIGALWAAPFTLTSFAELHITASLAAVLNAMTPLFAAVVAAVWLGERLPPRQLAGLPLGLAGVMVVVGWSPVPLSATVLLAAGASLLAAATCAVAGTFGGKAFAGVPSVAVATWQQCAGALLLLPVAPALSRHLPPFSTAAALAVTGLAVPCTALAFVLFFRLVGEIGATRALTVNFLVPIFGILWAALLLGEDVGWPIVAGLLLVFAGMALATGLWRQGSGGCPKPAVEGSRHENHSYAQGARRLLEGKESHDRARTGR